VITNVGLGNGLSTSLDGSYPEYGSRGNEILNNEIAGNHDYGLYISTQDNVIDGNRIHDNHGYGIHMYSSWQTWTDNNIVRNNVLAHNGWDNTNPAGSCAIILSSGTNNVAYNNVITDHNGCGVQVMYGASDTQVYNNTVVGNQGPCMDNGTGSSGATIRNNICYKNGADLFGGSATLSNNLPNDTDPQFVAGSWAPSPTSPAAGSGVALAMVPTDMAGMSRPPAPAIGACEPNSPCAPSTSIRPPSPQPIQPPVPTQAKRPSPRRLRALPRR
jgi:parallel beta-helix repeat protein